MVFGVWCLGLGIQGSTFRIFVHCVYNRKRGSGFGFRVSGFGWWVSGIGFRILGIGFRGLSLPGTPDASPLPTLVQGFIVYCLWFIIYGLLFIVYCLLFIVCDLVSISFFFLFSVFSFPILIVCFLLFIVDLFSNRSLFISHCFRLSVWDVPRSTQRPSCLLRTRTDPTRVCSV